MHGCCTTSGLNPFCTSSRLSATRVIWKIQSSSRSNKSHSKWPNQNWKRTCKNKAKKWTNYSWTVHSLSKRGGKNKSWLTYKFKAIFRLFTKLQSSRYLLLLLSKYSTKQRTCFQTQFRLMMLASVRPACVMSANKNSDLFTAFTTLCALSAQPSTFQKGRTRLISEGSLLSWQEAAQRLASKS